MADISPFNTQIAAGSTGQTGALKGSGKGVFSVGAGMAFWELILSRVGEEAQEILGTKDAKATPPAVEKAGDKKPVLTGEESAEGLGVTGDETIETSLLAPDAGLTVDEQIIVDPETIAAEAASPDGNPTAADKTVPANENSRTPFSLLQLALHAQANDGELPADIPSTRVERVQKRINQMTKLLDHLTNGLPQQVQDTKLAESLITKLEHKIETLQASLQELQSGDTPADQAPLGLLIALGLSPADLTKMQQRIDEVEEKLGRDLTVDDLIAGVGNIVPVPVPEETQVAGEGDTLELNNPDLLPSDEEPTDELAAKLNGLVVGGAETTQAASEEGGAEESALPRFNNGEKRLARGFEQIEKLADSALKPDGNGQKSGHVAKAGFSSFLTQNNVAADVAVPKGWYNAFFGGTDFSSFDVQAGLPLSQAAQAAHAATMITQAGQPHPATQMVAAQLTKAAKDGSPQSMTIQLDPPELGRVDVKLEFGPEKSVKATLTIEKPETHAMLQRDALILERALQHAGLDTGVDGITFDLAADGYVFDQNNNSDGGSSGSGGGSDVADTEEIDTIQSTMTWAVDPDTGHVSYDILA